MQFIDEQDFDPEDYDYRICLSNTFNQGINLSTLDEYGINRYSLKWYFLRKGFKYAFENADEEIITPKYIRREQEILRRVYHRSVDIAMDEIRRGEIDFVGFDYVPGTTKEQQQKAFDGVLSSFVLASSNIDGISNYLFEIGSSEGTDLSEKCEWIRYGNVYEDRWELLSDIRRKLKMQTANKQAKEELRPHIEQRKQEIRARLEQPNDKKYGVAAADRIAEAMTSGVIEDPVTPKRGNRIAANVERKIIADKIVDKIKKGR